MSEWTPPTPFMQTLIAFKNDPANETLYYIARVKDALKSAWKALWEILHGLKTLVTAAVFYLMVALQGFGVADVQAYAKQWLGPFIGDGDLLGQAVVVIVTTFVFLRFASKGSAFEGVRKVRARRAGPADDPEE